MGQELHTASCPLHSLSRGGWLIQGHLFFLPALRHPLPPLQQLCLTPKTAGLNHWDKLLLQRLHLLSALHLLCTGRRGQRGRNVLQTFTCVLKAPEEVSGPFLPGLTDSTHKTILLRACSDSSQEGFAGHGATRPRVRQWPTTETQGGYKPVPFVPALRGTGQRRAPAAPSVLPFMKTFAMQKPTASSKSRCQHACT